MQIQEHGGAWVSVLRLWLRRFATALTVSVHVRPDTDTTWHAEVNAAAQDVRRVLGRHNGVRVEYPGDCMLRYKGFLARRLVVHVHLDVNHDDEE